ncbi:DUF3139 domain-containing protein [Enterococcus sp. CWB-B31]|uniref:DUF3139 domain-containing protein n=1 Tax=Enterococcus sp. CWB-B31 TaxID=2885159 RepID=UPI001E4D364F|nr:hypothetical protein [Enterococcus sp. CWB-B31]
MLVIIGIVAIVFSSIYVYQIPVKKYIAEQELYELLENEYGLKSTNIQITNIIRDIKSVRGGVGIRFTVTNSSLLYDYDYSVLKKNWIRGYVENGRYYNTNKIFFEEE